MCENTINNIAHLENLYWAWEKLKTCYKDSGDIWSNQFDIASFETDLDSNLQRIREDLLNNSYELQPIYPVAYPKCQDSKGNPQTRPTYYINVRDQLTWIAIINVIGLIYDYKMPFWSYGHRLFITSWLEETGNDGVKIVKYGWYRNTTKKIYRSWKQSWPRFRRHISLTIKKMSNQIEEKDNSNIKNENLTDPEISEYKTNQEETREFIHNKYLQSSFWSKNTDDIYWCSIDFSKFYPSIKSDLILKNIVKYSDGKINKDDNVYNLIEKLLNFEISLDSGWEKEELNAIKIQSSDDIGLPTGLMVAGFLSNIALLNIDKDNEELINGLNIAVFRFVDDHIILAHDFNEIVMWYKKYIDICKLNGILINNEKTEPKEFQDFINKSEDSCERVEPLITVQKACKIDPLNPTPLVTQTLLKLSFIANQDINLISQKEQDELVNDLEHFLLAEFSENEIKRETQVSFALTMLSKIVPDLKKDYSKVNSLRKERFSINDDANNSKYYTKEIETELKKIDNKYNFKVERFYKLFIQTTCENFPKPKLWLRLIQFCINTGNEKTIEIFNQISKLKSDNIINELSFNSINVHCISIICDGSLEIIKNYHLNNKIFLDERNYSFLRTFFTFKNIQLLLTKVVGNKIDNINTRRILLLTYRFVKDVLNKSDEVIFSSVEDQKIFELKDMDRNKSILWSLSKLNNSYELTPYWIELSTFADIDKPNYKIIEILLKHNEIENENEKTIQSFLNKINESNNLLYSEYACLLIIKKIIKSFMEDFHGLIPIELDEIKINPQYYIFKNLPSQEITSFKKLDDYFKKLSIEKIQNPKINGLIDKIYIPDKIRSYNDKEIAEIYAIGIILWQMCYKISKLPYCLLFDSGRFIFGNVNFNNLLIKYYPTSYSQSLIASCLSNINRESKSWINKKTNIKDFYNLDEPIKKGYPPLISNLLELDRRIDTAILLLKSEQISLPNDKGRQLIKISCKQPSSNFDILANSIEKFEYYNDLKVGLIQTTLDKNLAWTLLNNCNIDTIEAERVWNEVVIGINNILNESNEPKIIILPELTIPRKYIDKLCRFANSANAIIIAGLDYFEKDRKVVNEAIVSIPNEWPNHFGYGYKKVTFGKYHFARKEIISIKERDLEALPNPNIYLFDTISYGKIGVAICADLFDIERFSIYKRKIQHLFILAYNQDVSSFYYIAEALARMVYCNVVICNTGLYGGSIVFSPYNEQFKRYKYKHEGENLFTSQLVSIPVKSLIDAQESDEKNESMGKNRFKFAPPGYRQ